jgi:hypothetical protein
MAPKLHAVAAQAKLFLAPRKCVLKVEISSAQGQIELWNNRICCFPGKCRLTLHRGDSAVERVIR